VALGFLAGFRSDLRQLSAGPARDDVLGEELADLDYPTLDPDLDPEAELWRG
jgi:hypothetical protein